MAAKPKITAEQRQLIVAVMFARRALPSDKQLARQLGISVRALYRVTEACAGAPEGWPDWMREAFAKHGLPTPL